MKNEIDQLLQKEMDRKAFLKHVGLGFAVISGAAAVIKTLNGFGSAPKRSNGYGSAPYGGNKVASKTQKQV
jgi:hypothetical protein